MSARPAATTRNRWALWIPLMVALIGAIDLVLLCVTLGDLGLGLETAAHDPGKFLFQLLMAPVFVWVLIRYFPSRLVLKMWRTPGYFASTLAIGILLLVSITLFAWDDVRAGFEDRTPWPGIMKGDDARELDAYARSLRTKMLSSDPIPQDEEVPEAKLTAYEKAHRDYNERVVATLGSNRSFWSQTSFRAKWAGGLTILSGAFGAGFLWTISLHFVARKRPSRSRIRALLVMGMLSAMWLALRSYSEWYGNFGDWDPTSHAPFSVVGFIVVVAMICIMVLRQWNPGTRISIVVTSFSIVAGIVAKIHPPWFHGAASAFARMRPPALGLIYLVGSLFLAGLIWLIVSPGTRSKASYAASRDAS